MRKVNAVTKPIFFPLPLLEDVFETVAENNPLTFSSPHCTSVYYQIKLMSHQNPKLPSSHIEVVTNSREFLLEFKALQPHTKL